jgi:hypothetical protein
MDNDTAGAAPSSHIPRVRVRMYRQGLGDSFLLTFGGGDAARHMLIDCGTLGATTTGVSLDDVVKDIRECTGGDLHILVATHEHWDHISLFASKRKKHFFGPAAPVPEDQRDTAIKVHNVWMAWTENPRDGQAEKLAKTRQDLGSALHAAMRVSSHDDGKAWEAIEPLLGFFGEKPLAAAALSKDLNEAMHFLRTGLGNEAQYHEPAPEPIKQDIIPGFRFYVLGPPRDEKALKNMGEHGSSQLYGLSAALRASPAAASLKLTMNGVDDSAPFNTRLVGAKKDAAERWHPEYFAPEESWRRVDESWLSMMPDLALQLDDLTNNTSLALAIERIADGKVLLFPGDAQEGHWLSWHGEKMRWRVPSETGGFTEVTAKDLLNRTVLYKVGHHSSHNATAKDKGLEMMTSKELVAFIPVDRQVAIKRNPPRSWQMPHRKLYRRLLERCEGRVVRSDLGWAADAGKSAPERELRRLATKDEWAQWRANQQASRRVVVPKDNGSITPYIDFVLD